MKTVCQLVPIELVLPERYLIRLWLNGELSELSIHEYYGADVPLEALDKTISIGQSLIQFSALPAKISKVSEREILLEVTGNESVVVKSLTGEIDLLRQLMGPPPLKLVSF